ncbi:hypothetical protein ACX80E_05185 [Arthrobacter sp. TMN-49]
MTAFRYTSVAILVAAVASVFFLDVPVWAKFVILAWPAASVAVNEYRFHKQPTATAEQSAHASDQLPDTLLHAYRESE